MKVIKLIGITVQHKKHMLTSLSFDYIKILQTPSISQSTLQKMTGRLLFYHLRPSYISSVCGNAIYEHNRHSVTADEVFQTIQPQHYRSLDECYDTPFIRFNKARLPHLVPRENLVLVYPFNEQQQSAKRFRDFYRPSHDCIHGNVCSKLATTCTNHDKHLQILLPRLNGIPLAHKAKLWPRMYGIECQLVVNQGLLCQLEHSQLNGQCHQSNRSLNTRGFYTMGGFGTIGNILVDICQNFYSWFLW